MTANGQLFFGLVFEQNLRWHLERLGVAATGLTLAPEGQNAELLVREIDGLALLNPGEIRLAFGPDNAADLRRYLTVRGRKKSRGVTLYIEVKANPNPKLIAETIRSSLLRYQDVRRDGSRVIGITLHKNGRSTAFFPRARFLCKASND